MWLATPTYLFRLAGIRATRASTLVSHRGDSILRAWRNSKDGMLDVTLDARSANGDRVALIRNAFVIDGALGRFQIASSANRYVVTDALTRCQLLCIERGGCDVEDLDVHLNLYMPDGFLLEATPDTSNLGRAPASKDVAPAGRAVLALSWRASPAGVERSRVAPAETRRPMGARAAWNKTTSCPHENAT